MGSSPGTSNYKPVATSARSGSGYAVAGRPGPGPGGKARKREGPSLRRTPACFARLRLGPWGPRRTRISETWARNCGSLDAGKMGSTGADCTYITILPLPACQRLEPNDIVLTTLAQKTTPRSRRRC